MAKPTPELTDALRKTAEKLKSSTNYQWGHMGSCNCGFLAQEITRLSKGEIHQYALRKSGDWTEQANDYCPTSGYPLDLSISEMLNIGLDLKDIKHLEKLSDPEVLSGLPDGKKFLKHNNKDDVVLYLLTWARILEEKIIREYAYTYESADLFSTADFV